jgi:hypothetical protein
MSVPMKLRAILSALALAAFSLLLMFPGLSAATGICNPPEGTEGFTRDGRPAACRDGTAAPCTGMMLGEGRVWVHCQPPKPAEADCYAEQRHRQWGGSQGDMCNSISPGTPADIGKHILQHARHGQMQELHDGFGNTVGRATYRCVRGTWSEEPVLWGCAYVNDPNAAPPPKPVKRPRQGDARVGPAPRP